MFRSGNEPIRTRRCVRPRRGRENSLRAELGYPMEHDLAMALLRAMHLHGGLIDFSVQGDNLESLLADKFNLSKAAREYSDPTRFRSKGARAWRNHIQFSSKRLVGLGLLDRNSHGKWRLTEQGRAMVHESCDYSYREKS